MLIRALHGAGPARMWIPGNNPADRTMAKRANQHRYQSAAVKLTYLEGE
jgi:hypothetical protein